MNVKNPEKLEELQEKEIYNISQATLTYHNQIKMIPVCMGQELEYIVSSRGHILEFWKCLRDLETSCSIKAYGHASEIYKISVCNTKNYVYSLGRSDNCLIEWKIDYDLSSLEHLPDRKLTTSNLDN